MSIVCDEVVNATDVGCLDDWIVITIGTDCERSWDHYLFAGLSEDESNKGPGTRWIQIMCARDASARRQHPQKLIEGCLTVYWDKLCIKEGI